MKRLTIASPYLPFAMNKFLPDFLNVCLAPSQLTKQIAVRKINGRTSRATTRRTVFISEAMPIKTLCRAPFALVDKLIDRSRQLLGHRRDQQRGNQSRENIHRVVRAQHKYSNHLK